MDESNICQQSSKLHSHISTKRKSLAMSAQWNLRLSGSWICHTPFWNFKEVIAPKNITVYLNKARNYGVFNQPNIKSHIFQLVSSQRFGTWVVHLLEDTKAHLQVTNRQKQKENQKPLFLLTSPAICDRYLSNHNGRHFYIHASKYYYLWKHVLH